MASELADDYLRRLHAAAWMLPPDRRTELVEEIRGHIAEATAESPLPEVLARLGAPEEIVAAEVDAPRPVYVMPPVPAPRRLGTQDWIALGLLALGTVWLFAGLWTVLVAGVLLRRSRLWTRLDSTSLIGYGAALLALSVIITGNPAALLWGPVFAPGYLVVPFYLSAPLALAYLGVRALLSARPRR